MSTSLTHREAGLRPDEVAIAQYRSLSRLALLSVALAVASALALVNLLFIPIALAAIVAAVLSLRAIAASQGQLVGKTWAVAGLALATLLLGWSVSWHFTRQSAIEGQARQVAEGWLRLISTGKIRQAHQLTVGSDRRVEDEKALDRLYSSEPDAVGDLNRWFNEQPLKDFAKLGGAAEFRFDSVSSNLNRPDFDYVTLKYLFRNGENPNVGAKDPEAFTEMWISLQRNRPVGSGPPDWKIMHVSGRAP